MRSSGAGALAGMVALVVYAVLSALFSPGRQATVNVPSAISPVAQVISTIVADVLVLALAALMGWLGGRPGAQRTRARLPTDPAATSADTGAGR